LTDHTLDVLLLTVKINRLRDGTLSKRDGSVL